jgi:ABC-2 type transport system ATP-binding protein
MKRHEPGEPLVKARGLTKKFNGRTAVDHIDFDVWPGEIVGFLGPNGAGKTTTIRMLMNILNPTDGELTLFGRNYTQGRVAILSQMNASSGTLTLPGKLTVEENLRVFGDMYGISQPKARIDELINKFDLAELAKRSLYSLSTGQQVRVALAKAFLNKPRLLLLDEPTSSLDPNVADHVRDFLLQVVKAENTTVFLTSHNMLEVEKVCSRVLFLNEGKIQAEGTPKELARRQRLWKLTVNGATIEVDCDEVGPYLTKLVHGGTAIESLSVHEPTLEDFFVRSARTSGSND